LCSAVVLWAGAWSALPVGAQSPQAKKWCLTFHEVHASMTVRDAREKGPPAGYRIYACPDCGSENELLLREEPTLHGGHLADAQPGFGLGSGLPIVAFRFNDEGTRRFALFTRDNIGRPFAIVVDGRVVSAPVVREPILGGAGEISGSGFTADTTARLAARMRSPTCA
jgi:preprotein translocase subunit SecD